MDASIIICTRDRSAHLRETLRSLSRVSVPPGVTSELIVVDNASTDDTWELVSSFPLGNMPLCPVREHQPGQSLARNTGLAAAKGDIILFTDDDLRFPKDWLESMCRPLRAAVADAVAGPVVLAPHLERAWMEPIHRYWLAETEPDAPDKHHNMVGANMAFLRTVLARVPGFDPALGPGALGFADDTLFSRQLWAAGLKVAFEQSAPVEHHFQPERLTRVSLLDAARKRGETKAYVVHHWEHREILAPAARMLQKRLQVALWYRRHPQLAAEPEGLPTGLMYNLEAYHFYRHYLVERRKPRSYEKHGLTKKEL